MRNKMEDSLGLHSVNSKMKVKLFEFTVSKSTVMLTFFLRIINLYLACLKAQVLVFELVIECLLPTCNIVKKHSQKI